MVFEIVFACESVRFEVGDVLSFSQVCKYTYAIVKDIPNSMWKSDRTFVDNQRNLFRLSEGIGGTGAPKICLSCKQSSNSRHQFNAHITTCSKCNYMQINETGVIFLTNALKTWPLTRLELMEKCCTSTFGRMTILLRFDVLKTAIKKYGGPVNLVSVMRKRQKRSDQRSVDTQTRQEFRRKRLKLELYKSEFEEDIFNFLRIRKFSQWPRSYIYTGKDLQVSSRDVQVLESTANWCLRAVWYVWIGIRIKAHPRDEVMWYSLCSKGQKLWFALQTSGIHQAWMENELEDCFDYYHEVQWQAMKNFILGDGGFLELTLTIERMHMNKLVPLQNKQSSHLVRNC
mmetsp:Transcript_11989/g.16260  ORF Transcript_11989/g.16260 Transcript_11989/m.16260 type:complete len:343 (-) Transcript_11989:60-1088(-)